MVMKAGAKWTGQSSNGFHSGMLANCATPTWKLDDTKNETQFFVLARFLILELAPCTHMSFHVLTFSFDIHSPYIVQVNLSYPSDNFS